MSLLTKIYTKLRTIFSEPTMTAAQAWQAVRGEAEHPYWLYAAPVNMLLGRDSFFLSEPAPMPISNDECTALIASLNQHFSGLGYYFYVVNDIWFLGLDDDPEITTTAIDTVKNKDVAAYLPQGDGALIWNKFQNEIQMLLFNHPVNASREAQGQPVVNSLWCYAVGAFEK